MLRKGFEAGLSKQQISNVFANQEALHAANVFTLTAIDTFNGVRSGEIKAVFYDDCRNHRSNECSEEWKLSTELQCEIHCSGFVKAITMLCSVLMLPMLERLHCLNSHG